MSFNFIEDREKGQQIKSLCKSIEWNSESIRFIHMEIRNTDDYNAAVEKLENILKDISDLNNDIRIKAGLR